MSRQKEKLVTIECFALENGVSVECVRHWIKHGVLKKYKAGRRTLVDSTQPRPERGNRWHGARIKSSKMESV